MFIAGARLAEDRKPDARYHGQPATVKQLSFEHGAPGVPAVAETFRRASRRPMHATG